MATVVFESKDAPPLVVEAPQGGSLADLCDEVDAPIPFSCRSANCGTCRVHVLEGEGELLPPEDEELDVLDALSLAPPKNRLACQAKMRPGAGTLRVIAADPDE